MKTPQLPHPNLAKALGLTTELYIKREDLFDPYGSHKGRSIPHMIKNYTRDGVREFVISSSGNAAIAAIHSVKIHNENNTDSQISLTIFVGQHVDEHKLHTITSLITNHQSPITVEQVERPLQSSTQFAKEKNATLLRQSTDDSALFGYHELAHELSHIPNLSAVFIPVSSGTTAEGIATGFETTDVNPQIHIVQTLACHPIADALRTSPPLIEEGQGGVTSSLASAIVDKIAYRSSEVKQYVESTGGAGWIPTEQTIQEAIDLLKSEGIEATGNGALALAGLKTALASGFIPSGAVVCLVCGR
jgi:threonine dehydratase